MDSAETLNSLDSVGTRLWARPLLLAPLFFCFWGLATNERTNVVSGHSRHSTLPPKNRAAGRLLSWSQIDVAYDVGLACGSVLDASQSLANCSASFLCSANVQVRCDWRPSR